MGIKICTVGGYNEVGKNMTVVKVDDEVIVLDTGIHLDAWIKHTDIEREPDMSFETLTRVGAIPDISPIEDWHKLVKAVVISHAHLDHVGAAPYITNRFKAPILCTPFTTEVLRTLCRDDGIKLKNNIKTLNVNSVYAISKNITIEFINATHSTPQTVNVALHTPYGVVLYATDFKFDRRPIIGRKTDIAKLKQIGKKNVVCLICDGTKAKYEMKTPSEQVARDMLKDVMLNTQSDGRAVFVTTFSSHLARLSSIIDFGKRMKRRIVFVGRSLAKYVEAGEKVGIIDFTKDIELVKYPQHVKRKLKQIQRNPANYLVVCTGHQGEAQSVLGKIIDGVFEFKFNKNDHIIFSCTIIPSPINIANRSEMERRLKQNGVRIFKDIHVSGHPSKEDIRDLLQLVKPKHIIPCHVPLEMAAALADVAVEEGFTVGETVHLMQNGQMFQVPE